MSESKCYAADGVTECHSVHGVGVLVSAVAFNGLLSENETLRAELAEARRQLKEASEQKPVEWKVESGTGTTRRFSTYAATTSHRDEGWTATPLYAAPVPQPADDFRTRLIALCQQWTPSNLDRIESCEEIIREVAEGPHSQPAVPVDDICNAYESGVGHNGRPTANVNPYPPGTPQHTAYELGAKGTKHNAPAVPEAVAKDSDWKHVPVGRVIGDPVWAGQLWSTQIRGTKKLRHGDLVFIHPAAILSATDSEVKNGLR